tara:strand:+ start:464 stop:796 length:333 start_codon:yes stop_codon:yes gene_type:complete
MINPLVRSIGLKLRLTILFVILTFASGCSEFAMLMSGASIAGTQNMYVKVYNGVDVLTILSTEKSMKKHVYEKGKKYIIEGVYDETRVKALAIIKEKDLPNFMDKNRILD